jgi:WD40 repeat protein
MRGSLVASFVQFFFAAIIALAHSFVPTFKSTRIDSTVLSSSSDNESFMASLRARQSQLQVEQQALETHWLKAKCTSTMSVALQGDWVRRLDVHYPLVACGTSSGNVAVHHMETGALLARSVGQDEVPELGNFENVGNMLYSGFDGGGTVAITMHKDLICSSARHGSVQVWRLDENRPTLVSQGSMESQRDIFVTCLKLDDDYLWIGRADGKLQAFSHKGALPLALQTEAVMEWDFGSTILSMSLSPDIGYGVVTLANGSVRLFSMDDDDDTVHSWRPLLEKKFPQNYLISCAIVPFKEDAGCSIACGSTDGSLFLQQIQCRNGVVSDDPFQMAYTELKPKHHGPAKCLASPGPGLLVSGGQDGSIRLWSVPQEDPKFLYQVRQRRAAMVYIHLYRSSVVRSLMETNVSLSFSCSLF